MPARPGKPFERSLPVKVVIPDASPLITLALATLGNPAMAANAGMVPLGRTYLDLLKLFGVPIQLVDQVVFEVTSRTDKLDARLIARWIGENRNRSLASGQPLLDVAITEIGELVQLAIASGRRPGMNKGEAAISEYLRRWDDYRVSEDEVDLVLYEDGPVKAILDQRPNVHLLTTLEFLERLERRGLVDVGEVLDSIRAADPAGTVRQDRKLRKDTVEKFDGPSKATEPNTIWEDGVDEGIDPWKFR